MMVTAIVPNGAETNRIPARAERFAEMEDVHGALPAARHHDLVANVCVLPNEEPAEVISDRMRHLDGADATENLIAFRAYSRKEAEAGFELGLD